MRETRYMISDASKKVEVEAHVLRYWEEELGLIIPRNELGHRYYREEDVTLLTSVRKLKDNGFQLKAIRMILPDISKVETLEEEQLLELRDRLDVVLGIERESEDGKVNEGLRKDFSKVVDVTERIAGERSGSIVTKEENQETTGVIEANEKDTGEVCDSNGINQDKLQQFRSIMCGIVMEAMQQNNTVLVHEVNQSVTNSMRREMDYFLKVKEEREEERFKQLDRTIREYQQSRQQAAATKEMEEKKTKKRSKFFQKNNVRI